MHEQPMRQLFSALKHIPPVLCCMVLFAQHALFSADTKTKPTRLQQELQAARLAEATLLARHAGHEDTQAARDDMEKLAHIYAQITSRYPKNAEALNAEAEYLWVIERQREAMEKWTAAESLEPGNAVIANHLGGCEIAYGTAEKAAEYFERAAKLDPENALYQYNAGNTSCIFRHQIAGAGSDPEPLLLRALEHFKQAARIEPFNIDYARSYAETFYIMRQPDWNTALKAWTHYLEITDQKDFAYANLARVNLKLGHKKEAGEALGMIQSEKFAPLKQHLQQEIDVK
jgi:tetratricopeptide (TPR) repeat protein